MPGKLQTYGKDYKTISVMVSPEEHRKYKIKAAQYGITIGEVVRMALADDAIWKKAVKKHGIKR